MFLFAFSLKYFKTSHEVSSLTRVLLRNVLFNLQVFGDFPSICCFCVIPLQSENRHCKVSPLLNLLRCFLWPRMWSILVNVSYELRDLCSAAVGWSDLLMFIVSSWLMVVLSSSLSLLIFCPLRLSFSYREELRSPTMRMNASISPCSSASFCLTYFEALLLGSTH